MIGTSSGLAAALRDWDDERLAALLLARPDLAAPAPAGLHALAARASSAASVGAALADLTLGDAQAARAVLDGAEPTPRLLDLALAWDERGTPALAERLAALVARADLGPDAPEPPAVALVPTDDAAAGAAAAEALTAVDEALWRLAAAPPRVLRAGGLPAADLRALARDLGIDGAHAALVVEVAAAARLLAPTDDEDPCWAPTAEYDDWRGADPGDRWAALALAWVESPRAPHLVGAPAPAGKGTINALSPEVTWAPAWMLRRHVLDELATLGAPDEPGASGPSGVPLLPAPGPLDAAALAERVHWRHVAVTVPDRAAVVAAVLREAAWLGIAAPGLTTPGAAVLAAARGGDLAAAGDAMSPLLPAPVDRLLLGADLTAVAPGLLERDVADLLRGAADVESRGPATVVRFTAASLDRALDAGWSAPALRERLETLAGPLPQPLAYLLDDAARRHGTLVVGGVASYLTCDDPAVLAELTRAPRLALRLVAPTVAVSDLAPPVLLARLRAAGRVPAVAGPDGQVHVVGAQPVRSRPARPRVGRRPLDADTAREVVVAVRAGGGGDATDSTEPETMRGLLADAAASGTTVRVDYVQAGGAPVIVDLAPVSVEPGRVRGLVDGVERVIALPRVSRVRA